MKKILISLLVILSLILVCGISGCVKKIEQPTLIAGAYNSSAESIYTEGRFIVINAVFTTPTPCYSLGEPEVINYYNTTQFRFNINSTLEEGQMCAQVISEKSIQFKYGPLEKRSYDVTIIGKYPGTGWEDKEIGPKEVTIE